MNQTQRIFITGAAGFIGSHLVDAFLSQQYQVIGIDDLSTGSILNLNFALQSPRFTFLAQDVSSFDWKAQLMPNDVIYHLASTVGVNKVYESSQNTLDNNHNMLTAILEGIKAKRNRLIYASTSEVYGDSNHEHSTETDTLNVHVLYRGRSAYTLSKLFGEMQCLTAANELMMPITVVRLFNTIGIRQASEYGMVVPRFIQQVINEEDVTIYGDGQQVRSFISVQDTVNAMLKLCNCKQSEGEIYNIGSPDSITIEMLADFIINHLGGESGKVFLDAPPSRQGISDIRYRKPNIQKLCSTIDWKPQLHWTAELAKIIDAYKFKPSYEH